MNQKQFDEFMAFGERIRKCVEDEKDQAEKRRKHDEWHKNMIAMNQRELESKWYYPFINQDFVYFAKDSKSNRVKIGWSNSVHDRIKVILNNVLMGNGVVIGLFCGGINLESRCHEIFKDYRIVGASEMFFYSDEMGKYLTDVMTDEEKELAQRLNEAYVIGWGGRV